MNIVEEWVPFLWHCVNCGKLNLQIDDIVEFVEE